MGFRNSVLGLFRRGRKSDAASGGTYRTGAASLWPLPEDTAMCVAAVYRCVKLLSESVANLPVQYLRRKGDIFVADEHSPMDYLLNVQPDKAVNAFDFWKQVVQEVLLDGNAYIVPFYEFAGAEPQIYRLALCGRGTVGHDTLNDTYNIADPMTGVFGQYDEAEVIHIKGQPGRDSKRGVGVLTHARLAASIAATGDRETRERFANGGAVRGIVSNDTSVRGIGMYQDNELRSAAVDVDGRLRNGERIVSIPGQIHFDQLSMSSTDMQFLESRKFTVLEICRFFGVHPTFVFSDTSSNYKSVEQANVAFLSHTLNPLLRSIETELQRKLIAPSRAGKFRIRFDRRGLYASDLESRARYQTSRLANGTASVNELRKEENLPPVDGGDRLFVSANLRAVDEAGVPQQPTTNQKNEDNDESDKE